MRSIVSIPDTLVFTGTTIFPFGTKGAVQGWIWWTSTGRATRALQGRIRSKLRDGNFSIMSFTATEFALNGMTRGEVIPLLDIVWSGDQVRMSQNQLRGAPQKKNRRQLSFAALVLPQIHLCPLSASDGSDASIRVELPAPLQSDALQQMVWTRAERRCFWRSSATHHRQRQRPE